MEYCSCSLTAPPTLGSVLYSTSHISQGTIWKEIGFSGGLVSTVFPLWSLFLVCGVHPTCTESKLLHCGVCGLLKTILGFALLFVFRLYGVSVIDSQFMGPFR